MTQGKQIGVFIFDHNEIYRELPKDHLLIYGYEVTLFSDFPALLFALPEPPAVIIIESHPSGICESEWLNEIKTGKPGTEVVILSESPDLKSAIHMIRNGAADYILKDENTLKELLNSIRRIEQNYNSEMELIKIPGVEAAVTEEKTLEEYTMRIIRYFLNKYQNNVLLTAKKLAVGKSTIYRYLKENKLSLTTSEQS